MSYIPDAYDLWEARDREQNEWLESLPKCAECGEPIQQDMAVCINGAWYCDDCLYDMRKELPDYE